MDHLKYLLFSVYPSFALTQDSNFFDQPIFYYDYYGSQNGKIVNIYDSSEVYNWVDVYDRNNTVNPKITTIAYTTIAPSGGKNIKDVVKATSPTDEQKNSQNILCINNEMLTNLLPWNKSELIRVNNTTGEYIPQSYIPLSMQQLMNNFPTIVKLIVAGYVVNYLRKKYPNTFF
jgi:hypothetical protein